jgi:transposase
MRVTPEELEKVKKAMDSEKVTRVYKRFRSLYLYLSGITCEEVAEIVDLSRTTVCRINQIYREQSLQGIPDKLHKGRQKRMTSEQESALKELILNQVPFDVGFPAEFNWTAGLIAKYIKREYGFDYNIKGITKILERLGLSYTRPTYVLAKADKQKQEQFIRDFDKLKKLVGRSNSTNPLR